ncbi:MAG TPA: 5-methyltetrahydropteroyltriglutamate--homocysteine S-methyltransferase [Polyangiaceae bacterium]|jgi:5-methyltetrahydropteroyltriglutamate--homocysteine methyltransferase|nr:5-methyltetrahydropteroyltriglutamate--homocysteine S-methyltransferase [Polyangiaceae bacterium]
MAIATNLGFPRIGANRELKRALERFWSGRSSEADLLGVASELRQRHWLMSRDAGITHIPSNDFSLYDHVLDTAFMVGAIPARHRFAEGPAGGKLGSYFAMARGAQDAGRGLDLPALEMTKWFDTNYHYIVPELEPQQHFELYTSKPLDEFLEARALGISTRPVLLGPVSFLLLSKSENALALLPALLPVYEQLFLALGAAGADWVQLDEPALVLDLAPEAHAAYRLAYRRLSLVSGPIRMLLTSYFGGLRDNFALAASLPVSGLHLDLTRDPNGLPVQLDELPGHLSLSLGVVDGRNIWRTDLDQALLTLQKTIDAIGTNRVFVAPSCSLLHVPVDSSLERRIDPEISSWLAFARQKLDEISLLTTALNHGLHSVAGRFEENRRARASRGASKRVHDPAVTVRMLRTEPSMSRRQSPYAVRRVAQARVTPLPAFPTTTIGSFPQTSEVRATRAAFREGRLDADAYQQFLRAETERAIRVQEELDLDVLVHGEFERTDMVEYFGAQLEGFVFSELGWVQSYGSRCVKPPIIYGAVSRPEPMTVEWASYAQSLTKRPMKGMLTGPVTILQWSFVRDDAPRSTVCRQIALAIRDEVADLEAAGIRIIQVDEPALREGLPLRRADWKEYLTWSVDAFRLASSGVRDETQIHSHMCYAEFNDIIEAVAALDADVISIETSRSKMELLDAFVRFVYPNELGPGVYDIHSPRVPSEAEMEQLARRAASVLDPSRLWINPDCGLKTRGWAEVRAALAAMVNVAKRLRAERALTHTAIG